jgi:hypothetical protein
MKRLISAFLVVVFSLCLFLFPQIALSQKASTKDSVVDGASIFKKVSPAVLLVRAITGNSQVQGSGVAFGHASKESKVILTWVVTNEHVIAGSNSVQVEVSGKTYPALIAYADPEIDIALLMVQDVHLPTTKVASADFVAVGDRVFAIGSPLGLKNSITEGIVSGIRELNGVKLIQTSAAISKGNSGGGLFDGKGRFVGITTFKITSGENLNFAIDAEYVHIIADAMRANDCFIGRYEYLQSWKLIKWLMTKKMPDDDPMYRYVMKIVNEFSETNRDLTNKKIGWVAEQYIAENESVDKSSSTSESNKTVYRVTCSMYNIDDGKFVDEITLDIDEDNELINGKPAQFLKNEIILQVPEPQGGGKFTLNRYTGTLTLKKGNKSLSTGKCVKAGECKF